MIATKTDAERINIANVNNGLLGADTNGFYLEIPMYPRYKTKSILSIYDSLNAPQEFYDNLKNDPAEEKQVEYYRINNFSFTEDKDYFKAVLEQFGLEGDLSVLYGKLDTETLHEAIKYMTDQNNPDYPLFVLKHEF